MNHRLQPSAQHTGSQTHLVHAAMRLFRIIRYRRTNVMASLIVASLLGALYYFTATQMFEARTSLMVLVQGNDDALPRTDGYRQGMLPTYERLLSSSVVLEGAAERLRELPEQSRIDLAHQPRDKWVEILRTNLSARAVRSTNFIEIGYLSRDPNAAVAVINAIVRSYLDFIDENQKNVATEIVSILDKGRSDVAQQLNEKEQELLASKKQIGDLGLRDGSRVTHPLVHNVIRINEALAEVRQERMRLEASSLAMREAIAQGRDLRHFMLSMEDAGGRDMVLGMLGLSARDEDTVKQVERELNEERAQYNSVLQYYGDAHPTVREMRESIQQNEQYLAEYRSARSQDLNATQNKKLGEMLQSTTKGKLVAAVANEQSLQRELSIAQERAVELNGRVAHVAILEHDLRMLRELHDTLRNRIANLDLKQDQAEVRLAVVSEAKPNHSAVTPRWLSVCCACVVGGVGVGVGLAYVLDVLDDRFRSADELRDQLGVLILAIVRQLPHLDAKGADALQVNIAPNGVESEAFRTLRSTLAFSDHSSECVAISSSEPGDGKTTVLSNLGAASAQAGKRTLLIDADMRRPGLTRLFDLRGKGGLADVLTATDGVGSACHTRIQRTGVQGLDVLPCGPLPTDPSGLLSNVRFAELVSWATDEYDQVLIDTPPILAASDAAIVGRLTSGIVLVVHPSKNHRRLVHRAVDEIRSANLDLLGVVVNRISDGPDNDYGYAYGYGQGYGHGYQDDGNEFDEPFESNEADDAHEVTPDSLNALVPAAEPPTVEPPTLETPEDKLAADQPIVPRRPASPWTQQRRAA